MGRTVTLSDDVTARLEKEAERTGASAEEIVNETLRRNLKETEIEAKPFVVRARSMGTPMIDLTCTARALELLDELERKDVRETK